MRPRPGEMVVVVTGASSGIGRATCLEFARRGAAVVMTARRAAALEEVADTCRRLGAQALAVPADVTDEEAVRQVVRAALATFGRIDVWVNNAAVTLFGRLEEVPMEEFRRVIETNLYGYVHGARAVMPVFREQGQGVLINISSMLGRSSAPYLSAYVASKWAIEGLSESLRQEIADARHIHVATIRPASIDTPLLQHAANHTGRGIRPLEPVYAPERVARTIARLSRRPHRAVYAGNAGRMLGVRHHVLPWLGVPLAGRRVERDHFDEGRPAAATSGNLFTPDPRFAQTGGNWARTGEGRQRRTRRLVFALTAAVALAYCIHYSRRDRARGTHGRNGHRIQQAQHAKHLA